MRPKIGGRPVTVNDVFNEIVLPHGQHGDVHRGVPAARICPVENRCNPIRRAKDKVIRLAVTMEPLERAAVEDVSELIRPPQCVLGLRRRKTGSIDEVRGAIREPSQYNISPAARAVAERWRCVGKAQRAARFTPRLGTSAPVQRSTFDPAHRQTWSWMLRDADDIRNGDTKVPGMDLRLTLAKLESFP